ncbi:MAG: hypothetical protein HQ543_08160 [Bacteroidetes bacterium]|nr:hypothetical protein [Bacteroidota bacterium]
MKFKRFYSILMLMVFSIGIFYYSTNNTASAYVVPVNGCGDGYAFYCGYYSWGGPDVYASWVYEGPYYA